MAADYPCACLDGHFQRNGCRAGTSFVVLLATLGAFNIPAEGLAFIARVDRIMDMARTVVNLTGNALASVVMSKWEGQYDPVKGAKVMSLAKTEQNTTISG